MIKCYGTEMYSSFSSNFCQIAALVTFLDFCKKIRIIFPTFRTSIALRSEVVEIVFLRDHGLTFAACPIKP